MLVNIIILSLIALFILYCIISEARHFIGYNPNPKPWRERLKEWADKHLIDHNPTGEDHSKGRGQ